MLHDGNVRGDARAPSTGDVCTRDTRASATGPRHLTMALDPGTFRPRSESVANRVVSGVQDADVARYDVDGRSKVRAIGTRDLARAWTPREPPPRTRARRFSMDVTRREVSRAREVKVGDRWGVRVAVVCQEGWYPRKEDHVNQDAWVVVAGEGLTHREESIDEFGSDAVSERSCGELLLGVFDGHGKHGEACATIAGGAFAEFLKRETRGISTGTGGYERTFERVNATVCDSLGDDASFSGSTAITALFDSRGTVRVGNVGDSRAVVGVEVGPGQTPRNRHTKKWEVRDLTRDQTCFRADERKRMRVEAQSAMTFATIGMVLGETESHEDFGDGEPGSEDEYCDDPPRVFMAGQRFPGCAFTRSIGDTVGKSLGVSATPEMSTYDLAEEPSTRCLILASDGVFEFMSSAETMAIAEKFYDENAPEAAELAAHAIVRAAYTRWQENDERADDITAVVAFIYPADPGTSTATVVVNDVIEATMNKLAI